MRFPDQNDSNATLFKLGRYAGARVLADPEVARLASLIRAPHQKLKEAVGRRNDAADAVTDDEAGRDFHLDALRDLVNDLALSAHAHFKSRDHQGFTRLFPEAPSTLAATPAKDRAKVLGAFVRAVSSPKTPKELALLGKQVAETWKLVQAGDAAVGEAEKAAADADDAVGAAREAWFTGYRRLHAQLTDRFPTDKKRVGRYFKSASAGKGKGRKAVVKPAQVASGGEGNGNG